ncbi:MAG TPA: hypothetical protein PKE45_07940 [Caldilineaceae bacterium]|nr:hypothetical protein [Caldilineaceae bacterium]
MTVEPLLLYLCIGEGLRIDALSAAHPLTAKMFDLWLYLKKAPTAPFNEDAEEFNDDSDVWGSIT